MSLRRFCLNEGNNMTLNDLVESEGDWNNHEYLDTTDSGKLKEVKAFKIYRMEIVETCEKYITLYSVEGLDTFDGVTDLEYDKNLISNEFVVKLGLTYEVKKMVTRLAKANIDFRSSILTIWLETMLVDSDDDGLDTLLASINFNDLPPLDPPLP
ncbi:hypothetical protein Tco_0891905 [Tanacetum coccineum]|uniref:Uncharacterized protein n=1 Tax=Tanacetum coccineum TaxID=301880 RepID=A0ABQ5C5R2_9ASTR